MTKKEKIDKLKENQKLLTYRNPEFARNTIDVIDFLHTHAELCSPDERVYKEENVLILIIQFYNKGFADGVNII